MDSDLHLLFQFKADSSIKQSGFCSCSCSYILQLVLFIILYITPILFLIIPKIFATQENFTKSSSHVGTISKDSFGSGIESKGVLESGTNVPQIFDENLKKKSGFTTEYNITHTIPDDYSDIGTQECASIFHSEYPQKGWSL